MVGRSVATASVKDRAELTEGVCKRRRSSLTSSSSQPARSPSSSCRPSSVRLTRKQRPFRQPSSSKLESCRWPRLPHGPAAAHARAGRAAWPPSASTERKEPKCRQSNWVAFEQRRGRTYLFNVRTSQTHVCQQPLNLGRSSSSLLPTPPSSPPRRPVPSRIRLPKVANVYRRDGVSGGGDSDGNQTVADLAHDDPPVGSPSDGRLDSLQFRLPIRSDLVC